MEEVRYATRRQLNELYRLTGRDQYPTLTQGEAGRLIRQARKSKKGGNHGTICGIIQTSGI